MNINRLNFSIDIKADKARIWAALWNDSSYRDWSSLFFEGSYVVSDNWKQGSTVQFLGPGQNGIYSTIETHVPNQVMAFRHIGNVVEGKNQPIDEETKKWSGTTEVYTLTEGTDHHTLTVEIDVFDEHLEFMKDTLPKALERIKQIALGD